LVNLVLIILRLFNEIPTRQLDNTEFSSFFEEIFSTTF